MDVKYWKALAGLGVPGVVLGVFYKLYDKFDWPLAKVPPEKIFVLVLVAMILIAFVVVFTLFLWRPRPEVKAANGAISVNIPKGCTFQVAARTIAGGRLVQFEGFSDKELSSPLESRQLSAPNAEQLINKLGQIATRKIRPYNVTLSSASGDYVARVV